ncbi:MAG TPA: MFS transporter [Streptosporangiaceae bacterium]|nr:MFS transporter [Streptosporangiaceae bacterium]
MTALSQLPDHQAATLRRRATGPWLMLVILLGGQFMALLDVTIVNVAMPDIGRTLHASGAALQLVVAGYTVSYAMLLITGARLGALFGRRRLFLAGVALFTVSSLVCGLAPDAPVLIVARFVQGAGAAAMVPQIISVIQARFTGATRARALSAYSAVLAAGFVCGQVLGGVIVSANLSGMQWRPVFLVNVPIGLAVLALVPRVMPAGADVPAAPAPRAGAGATRPAAHLDLGGLAVAVPAVFLIVLPLVLGHQEGWPWWTLAAIAAGLVLAAIFVWVERRKAATGGTPLLNLRVLRSPGIVSGLAAVALTMVAYGGFLFSLSLHMQDGLGYSPLRAGLTFAPCAAAFGLTGYYWNRLPQRWHQVLTPAGLALAAVAEVVLGLELRAGTGGGAAFPLVLLVLGGAMGIGFSPLVTHALAQVPVTDAADASGLLTTTLQLGQVTGVATFGSLFLTLAGHGRFSLPASPHAIALTSGWLALLFAAGAAAALPLSRTVIKSRRAVEPGRGGSAGS